MSSILNSVETDIQSFFNDLWMNIGVGAVVGGFVYFGLTPILGSNAVQSLPGNNLVKSALLIGGVAAASSQIVQTFTYYV